MKPIAQAYEDYLKHELACVCCGSRRIRRNGLSYGHWPYRCEACGHAISVSEIEQAYKT